MAVTNLLSVTVLEMLDIDGDGKMEFVTFGHNSLEEIGKDGTAALCGTSGTARDGFQTSAPEPAGGVQEEAVDWSVEFRSDLARAKPTRARIPNVQSPSSTKKLPPN
jgi:hypothetical protein